MNEAHLKALEAAVSHGFKKGDFVALGQALLGECEERTSIQKQIQEQVHAVAQAITDITQEDFVEFADKREALQTQLDAANHELNTLKEQLAGDENGVLNIQSLYIG